MCLEDPAQVIAVDPDGLAATVTTDQRIGRVLLMALDAGADPVRPGDWLLVHSGLAVERLGADEAHGMLDLIAQARAQGDVR